MYRGEAVSVDNLEAGGSQTRPYAIPFQFQSDN
jgi:hypothetical protein